MQLLWKLLFVYPSTSFAISFVRICEFFFGPMTSLWVYFRCFLSAIRRRQWINMNWELTGAYAVWSRLRSALMWGWTRGDAALETFTAVTPDSARSLDLHLKPPEPNERTCSLIAIRYSSTSRAAGNLQCRRPECTNCDVIIDLWHRYISVYCKTETKLRSVPLFRGTE